MYLKVTWSRNGMVYAPRRPDTQQTTGSTRRTFGPEANNRNKNDHIGWNPGQRGNHLYNGRTKRRYFTCGMVGHVVKDCWNSVQELGITAKPETGAFLQVKMHSVLYKIYVVIVMIFNAPVMTLVISVAI